MPHDAFSANTDESFLLRTLEILGRRKVLALITLTSVLAIVVSFACFLPDIYRANAVVLVERQLPETFVRPGVGGELESRLHVIKQEVLSRARLTELINRFGLYPDFRARNDMEGALEQVRHDIEIELTGPEQLSGRTKTVAFNLTFTGSERDTVAEVTNSIAAFYVAQNTQMRSDEAARTAQFLKAQLEDARGQLTQNEQDVKAFTNQHVGELPQQVGVNLATLERLNTQLRLNGERQLRTLEQRERVFEELGPTATVPRAEGRSATSVRLDQLKRDLAQLEGFPEKHPDVKRLKDEIANLERDAQTAPTTPAGESSTTRGGPRTLDSLDAELNRLKADDARLRQTIATLEKRLEDVPYRQNEFSRISRDHDAAKDLYDSLLKRYEEAQLAQSMENENQGERFRVLEAAVAPMGPSAPNRPRLLIMGVLLAILLSGLTILLREQFDTSFHSVDDLRQFTNVPVLVAVPRIGPVASRRLLHTVGVTACVLAGLTLIATLSAYFASANDQLVRLLVRGG